MLDLKGKRVLITGASRGLGRLAAKLMAEQGCNLILQSRSLEHTASLDITGDNIWKTSHYLYQ